MKVMGARIEQHDAGVLPRERPRQGDAGDAASDDHHVALDAVLEPRVRIVGVPPPQRRGTLAGVVHPAIIGAGTRRGKRAAA